MFFQKKSPTWDSQFELVVNLELNVPEDSRPRRPYVAVWAEDEEGFPIRTAALWVQARQPGPRWFPDLRRWFRSDRMRRMTDKTDLIATVSSPTRQPGKYSVVWDGKDDQGKPVSQGDYTIYVEVAREHGTYQLIKKAVNIGTKPFQTDLGGNVEVKAASLDFRRKKR